jgi:hypothetical protein
LFDPVENNLDVVRDHFPHLYALLLQYSYTMQIDRTYRLSYCYCYCYHTKCQ